MAAKTDIKQEVITEALNGYIVFVNQHGIPYIVANNEDNSSAIKINSRNFRRIIRKMAFKNNCVLTEEDLSSMVSEFEAHAHLSEKVFPVYHRVAPIEGGIEIDLADPKNLRVRVTASGVEVISAGSTSLLSRSPSMQPMVKPASQGDYEKLLNYLNCIFRPKMNTHSGST
jgi:hypothetical protein